MNFLRATFLLPIVWANALFAQTIPFEIKNNSPYADNQLYVAIVGEDLTGPPGAHVWVDMTNGQQMPMSPSYNTVAGPVYGGNKGPGNNGMYAACFTKLSDIPNKTVSLAGIQGCRMFISIGSPLYMYFFGATGAPSGYASPNHTDPTDPNKGIAYEIIEMTYNQYGFWGNTTRVDSYNYPMGLELWGGGNSHQKTGELKVHTDIGADFLASVPIEFQGCYNPNIGVILFPTKTEAFADGTIGTMPNIGPYVDYMKPYIDAVWTKYANEDLIFSAGDAGVWKGRVQNVQLVMVAQSGGFNGRTAIISRRPTTQEVFEGKGVLNQINGDAPVDLMMQAQICAAISRHVINTTTPNVGTQNFSDPSQYYLSAPCNYYAKFFHENGISYNNKTYAFAYDDVFDQSSTLQRSSPSKILVTFGGFADWTTTVKEESTAFSLTQNYNISVYDIQGKKLHEYFGTLAESKQFLPTGLYLLKLNKEGENRVVKWYVE
ncbi:MAG: beta-1,3-glucanase family protein [Flavobacteriales bacterium]